MGLRLGTFCIERVSALIYYIYRAAAGCAERRVRIRVNLERLTASCTSPNDDWERPRGVHGCMEGLHWQGGDWWNRRLVFSEKAARLLGKCGSSSRKRWLVRRNSSKLRKPRRLRSWPVKLSLGSRRACQMDAGTKVRPPSKRGGSSNGRNSMTVNVRPQEARHPPKRVTYPQMHLY